MTRLLIALVTSALMLAGASLSSASISSVPDDCPFECPAGEINSASGSVPTGVTYSFAVWNLSPGDGNPDCSTCTACSANASLIVDCYGTGWCVSVNVAGGGWSTPDPKYARPGKLHADCADSFCVHVRILRCNDTNNVAYDELRCLTCGCGD